MSSTWRTWIERVDALDLRQRALLLLAVLTLVYVFWEVLFMTPMDRQRRILSPQVAELRRETLDLDMRTQALVRERAVDPDDVLRARLARLRDEAERENARMGELAGHLVPPPAIAGLLEAVLTREPDLKLIRLKGMGSWPALEADPQGPGDAPAMLYRHGMQLVFNGSYLKTLDYLHDLEELPWPLIWDGLALKVEQHPMATVTLEVSTLSLDSAWLGGDESASGGDGS